MGNRDTYTWGQINNALMMQGLSSARISDILITLSKIKRNDKKYASTMIFEVRSGMGSYSKASMIPYGVSVNYVEALSKEEAEKIVKKQKPLHTIYDVKKSRMSVVDTRQRAM